MLKPSKKWLVLAVSATLCFSAMSASADEEYDSTNVGISAAVDRYIEANPAPVADPAAAVETNTDEVVDNAEKPMTPSEDAAVTEATPLDAATESAAVVKYPQFEGKALATVSGNLNIRKDADAESEKVGTLARGGICLVKEQGSEWSLIASGNCVGYVKNEYLAFGDAAGDWAEANGISKVAVVNTTTLKVREDADENSTCMTLIPEGESYTVLGTKDDWTKIEIDDDFTGYVKSEYVNVEYKTVKAVTVEEQAEKERKAAEKAKQEEEAKKAKNTEAATEAEKKSDKKSDSKKSDSKKSDSKKTETATEAPKTEAPAAPSGGTGSATKSDLVSYALQFVGNPYVYGGNSLTNGTDCSGFTMLIYKQYGYSLPHSASAQSNCGTEISVSDVQPGDLLFYSKNGSINHVALYIGGGQVVHASTPSSGIKISSYNYRTPCKAVRIMQ